MVTSKWILLDVVCNIWQHKQIQAKVETREFPHKEGEDHERTFALVSRYTIIIIIDYVMELHYVDVKVVFLNEKIEKVYMNHLKTFRNMKESLACKRSYLRLRMMYQG